MKREPKTSAEQEIESTIVIDSTDHSNINDPQKMPQMPEQQEILQITAQQETIEEPETAA